MEIILLTEPDGEVITRVQQYGTTEGEFYTDNGGRVLSRHPLDSRLWLAAPDTTRFQQIATVWNRYNTDVATKVGGGSGWHGGSSARTTRGARRAARSAA